MKKNLIFSRYLKILFLFISYFHSRFSPTAAIFLTFTYLTLSKKAWETTVLQKLQKLIIHICNLHFRFGFWVQKFRWIWIATQNLKILGTYLGKSVTYLIMKELLDEFKTWSLNCGYTKCIVLLHETTKKLWLHTYTGFSDKGYAIKG